MNKAFVREPEDDGRAFCPRCGNLGVPVNGGALDTHIRPESRAKMLDAAWYCGFYRCDVAYFNLFGGVVLTDELKGPVYPHDANAPICACFGLKYDDVVADVDEGTPRGFGSRGAGRRRAKRNVTCWRRMGGRAWGHCRSCICG